MPNVGSMSGALTNEFPMPANEAVKHYAFDRRGQRFAQWLPT